ncbi:MULTISPECIES: hypothetical protein [unclassified Curtobacterium]|uniref:hypothetical protein n=1 Tax=unclassified Curtobacterium TaxID=257496 RepID=UPI0008DE3BE2|nr:MULTISPECIES: hypothetical protein [unclassified Curtobacterium]WIA97874.1 hypothetical protein QOL16_05650 [Curtobacterium sp. MCBA15_004]WIB01147.1 hypothetical protein QOL15_05500 [Curtobacterium sp. MCBA15_012]
MSSSDAQPPLSRREARERERAAAAGSQPVTPPPTVTPQADQPSEERRRPGSHVAPSPSGPAQRSAQGTPGAFPLAPASGAEASGDPSSSTPSPASPAPASATEIVPGTGGLTRRQLRLRREAEGQAVQPVPLRAPTPQSSDRTVQDVLGSVDRLDTDEPPTPVRPASAAPSPAAPERAAVPAPSAQDAPSVPSPAAPVGSTPTPSVPSAPEPGETVRLDAAAVAQATEADGSPDDLEPLSEAAAHAEEPRRHRSTWSSPDEDADADTADTATTPGTDLPTSSTPVVFPLSLDDDTNEVPVQRPTSASARPASADDAPRVPASFARPVEPKPVTTAFTPPAGHWSQLADDANDAEVHDEETGTRRVAVQNTNSIVLPDSALADPTGALNATGEVILTGSIDLPASLSSTGSHRPIDGAEVDRLLEQHDEQPETDASPVRASRAISSHTSTRQVVLAAAKPKESRTPVILGVTVGAVGLAAAAVIIVALVTTHMGG